MGECIERAELIGGFNEVNVTADAGEAEDTDAGDGDAVGVKEEPRGCSPILYVKQVGWGDKKGSDKADEEGSGSPQRAVLKLVASDGPILYDSRNYQNIRGLGQSPRGGCSGCGTQSVCSVPLSVSVPRASAADSILCLGHSVINKSKFCYDRV